MSAYQRGVRALTTAATLRVIAVAARLLLLVWLLSDVLLLIFAAVLTNEIMRRTGIRDGIALAGVTILLALVVGGLTYYLGPRLVTQGQALWTNLHQQFHSLDQTYGDTAWNKILFHKVSPSLGLDRKIASSTEAVVASTADDLITAFVLIITAIYFAINPGLYVRGAVALVPVPYRNRAREILHHIRMTLSWWLIGQCIDMVVGLMSAIGLSLLGIPLALALAMLAGLLTFIPYFGAVAAGGFISAAPVMAQTTNANSTTANSSTNSSSAQQLVNDATQTVQKIKADSHFDTMLKQSKGVFIMPNVMQGAFIVGGKGAQGVLLKHNSDGTWSDPVFLTLGSVSVGAQTGGKAEPAAMILITDKAFHDFTQSNNFSLNANAGLTVVNYSAKGQASVGKGDIVVWSDQSGVFAGVNVSGADINQDHAYYGKQVDAKQILSGDVSNPHASKLKDALPA